MKSDSLSSQCFNSWAASGEHQSESAPHTRSQVGLVVDSWSRAFKYTALVALLHSNIASGEHALQNSDVEFRATGIINISRDSDQSSDRALNFEAFVKGDRWLIRTQPFEFLTNKTGATIESYQIGTDGTNNYSLELFNASYDQNTGREEAMRKLRQLERMLEKSGNSPSELAKIKTHITQLSQPQAVIEKARQTARNQAGGKIVPGIIPAFSERDLIAPVWLALCSCSVLGQSGTNLVPGLFAATKPDDPLGVELFVQAEVKHELQFPFLPQFVSFSENVVRLTRGAQTTTTKTFENSGPPVVLATYEASFRDYSGLYLPTNFLIKRYSRPAEGGAQRLRYVISGRISEISQSVGITDFLPNFPVVAAVSDKRHSEIAPSGVRVFVEQGSWPTVETVRKSKEYSKALNQANSVNTQLQFRRTTILLSILLVSITVVVLVWKTRNAKH